jgi:beta-glucanase (GH16 family)
MYIRNNINDIGSAWIFIVMSTIFFSFSCSKEKSNPLSSQEPEITVPPGYKLVWNDEFDQNSISQLKWEHEVNADGGGNNELQYYTSREENSFVRDGNLVIRAKKETYSGGDASRNYTSARLRTRNKGDWRYGRFEIRAKLPYGQGLWPAIWMLPTDWVYGGWAASGEIDIMELLGHEPDKIYGTIHYGGEYPENQHKGETYTLKDGTFASDFHIFVLEWEPQVMRWYVDGILYYSTTSWFSANSEYPAPFDRRFHLLLNVAIGGNFPGNPDASTSFPQEMRVDYVRVFEKTK